MANCHSAYLGTENDRLQNGNCWSHQENYHLPRFYLHDRNYGFLDLRYSHVMDYDYNNDYEVEPCSFHLENTFIYSFLYFFFKTCVYVYSLTSYMDYLFPDIHSLQQSLQLLAEHLVYIISLGRSRQQHKLYNKNFLSDVQMYHVHVTDFQQH